MLMCGILSVLEQDDFVPVLVPSVSGPWGGILGASLLLTHLL